eukprot:jgi/Tetstr1/458546/TSEL_044949.t1
MDGRDGRLPPLSVPVAGDGQSTHDTPMSGRSTRRRGSGVQEDGLHGEMEGTSGGLPHRGTLRGSSRARLPAEHPEFESGVHTPQVLYRNRFRYNGSKGGDLDSEVKLGPGVKGNRGKRRSWQCLEMRLPRCCSQHEHAVLEHTLKLILGGDSRLISTELSRPMLEITLADCPTSRLHSQLVASWFGSQIAFLANTGAGLNPAAHLHATGHNPLLSQSLPELSTQIVQLGDELVTRLMDLWEIERQPPQPFMWLEMSLVRVEGVKIPNDRRFLQAMLQVAGVAAAAVTHQVGLQCHERGRLLTSVWNLLLGLIEFEGDQLRQRNDKLMMENMKQKELLHHQSGEEFEYMKAKVKELEAFQWEALTNLKILRDDNAQLKKDIKKTKEEAEQTVLTELQKMDATVSDLKWQLGTATETLAQTEAQLDMSFTALHAATEQANQLRKHGEGAARSGELQRDLRAMGKQLDAITELEVTIEDHMRANLNEGDDQASSKKLLSKLMKSKAEAKEGKNGLVKQLVQLKSRRRSNGDPLAAAAAAAAAAGDRVLNSKEKIEEALAEAQAAPQLLAVRMGDVAEMKRDEMWTEIQRLREREATMVELIVSMEKMKLEMQQSREQAESTHMGKGRLSSNMHRQASIARPPWATAGFKTHKNFLQTLTDALVRNARGREAGDTSNDIAGVASKALAAQQSAKMRKSQRKISQTKLVRPGAEDAAAARKLDSARVEALRMRVEYKELAAQLRDAVLSTAKAETAAEGPEERTTSGRRGVNFKAPDGISAASEAIKPVVELPDYQDFFFGLFKVLDLAGDASPGPDIISASRPISGKQVETNVADGVNSPAPQQAHAAHDSDASQTGMAADLADGMAAGNSSRRLSIISDDGDDGSFRRRRKSEGGSKLAAKAKKLGKKAATQKAAMDRLVHAAASPRGNLSPMGQRLTSDSGLPIAQVKHKSALRRIAKVVGNANRMSRRVGGGESPITSDGGHRASLTFKDQTIREAMYRNAGAAAKTPDWAMKVVDAVYKKSMVMGAKGDAEVIEASSIPELTMAHFTSQYGDKKIVQEYLAAMIATLRQYAKSSTQLAIFQSFLTEEWNKMVLFVFLSALNKCITPAAVNVPCIEYPADAKGHNRGQRYLCLRKAMVVGHSLLGARNEACTSKFTELVERMAVPVTEEDKASFWTPVPGETIETVEAKAGPLRKVPLHEFLHLLCQEAHRLEQWMHDGLRGLFKEKQMRNMLEGCWNNMPPQPNAEDGAVEKALGQLWDASHRHENLQEDARDESCGLNVSFPAFELGAMRCSIIRQYMRYKSPARQDELAHDVKEEHQKRLYMMVQRNWDHFAHCWNHVRSLDGGAGVHLVGQATRMEGEVEGNRKSRQYLQILKGLFEHRLEHIAKLCKAGGDGQDEAKLEDLMFEAQQGIKVAYGYQALLEDDNEYFEHMLASTATLAQRSRASRLWLTRSRMFLSYKVTVQQHAARLMQMEMGSRLLSKLRRRQRSAQKRGPSVTYAEEERDRSQSRDAVYFSSKVLQKTHSKGTEGLVAATQRQMRGRDGVGSAGEGGETMPMEELLASASPRR